MHLRWGKRGSDGAHQDLIDQLEAARQEWRAARAYFDSVSDSPLPGKLYFSNFLKA